MSYLAKFELVRLEDGSNATSLARISRCKRVELSIKYLRMLLKANYKEMRTWASIVARFVRILAG